MTKIIKNVTLVGGFAGVCQEGCVFRPHISMAIRDADNYMQVESK